MMLALGLPSLCVIYYNNITTPKESFDMKSLFGNTSRLVAGIVQAINFVMLYAGFKLLPMFVSIPYYFLFGLSAVLFAYFVNHESPSIQQLISYSIILIGTCIVSFSNITLNNSTIVGLGLLTVCIFLFGFNITFMKPVENKAILTESSNQIAVQDESRPKWMIASIQLLEMSVITAIVIVFLLLILLCFPQVSTWLHRIGVPDTIISLTTGDGATTFMKMFGYFLIFAYSSNCLRMVADDYLNTDLYSGGEYFNVIFAIIASVVAFQAQLSYTQIIGLIVIIIGACIIVYNGFMKTDNSKHISSTSQPSLSPRTSILNEIQRLTYLFFSIK